MGATEKIKFLLIKRDMRLKDLANKLGCSSGNLSNKFRRDDFSEKELLKIAEALNCDYESVFKLRDTGEQL